MFSLRNSPQVTWPSPLFLFPGQPPGALGIRKSPAGSRVTYMGFPFDYNQVLTVEDKALKEWHMLWDFRGRLKFK